MDDLDLLDEQKLLEEYEKAKERLKEFDENIKKLSGRDLNETRFPIRRPPANFGYQDYEKNYEASRFGRRPADSNGQNFDRNYEPFRFGQRRPSDTNERDRNYDQPSGRKDPEADTPPTHSGGAYNSRRRDPGVDSPPKHDGGDFSSGRKDPGADTPPRHSGGAYNSRRRDSGLDSPPKRGGGAFSRLGGRFGRPRQRNAESEEEPENKPSVQSSVVKSILGENSRRDKIEETSKDSAGKERNKRMFGMLLGTLQQFKTDSQHNYRSYKEVQRRNIEQKLEDNAIAEKEKTKQEREELFQQRKRQRYEIGQMELKMERLDIFAQWEAEATKLMNFVRTQAKPSIFYLPKNAESVAAKKLKDTRKYVTELIANRKENLKRDIEALSSSFVIEDNSTEKVNDKMGARRKRNTSETSHEVIFSPTEDGTTTDSSVVKRVLNKRQQRIENARSAMTKDEFDECLDEEDVVKNVDLGGDSRGDVESSSEIKYSRKRQHSLKNEAGSKERKRAKSKSVERDKSKNSGDKAKNGKDDGHERRKHEKRNKEVKSSERGVDRDENNKEVNGFKDGVLKCGRDVLDSDVKEIEMLACDANNDTERDARKVVTEVKLEYPMAPESPEKYVTLTVPGSNHNIPMPEGVYFEKLAESEKSHDGAALEHEVKDIPVPEITTQDDQKAVSGPAADKSSLASDGFAHAQPSTESLIAGGDTGVGVSMAKEEQQDATPTVDQNLGSQLVEAKIEDLGVVKKRPSTENKNSSHESTAAKKKKVPTATLR